MKKKCSYASKGVKETFISPKHTVRQSIDGQFRALATKDSRHQTSDSVRNLGPSSHNVTAATTHIFKPTDLYTQHKKTHPSVHGQMAQSQGSEGGRRRHRDATFGRILASLAGPHVHNILKATWTRVPSTAYFNVCTIPLTITDFPLLL